MGGTILCVDDDRNLCKILSEALRGEGYHVESAFDGEQALLRVAEDAPDLILLDLILQKRDGFAVMEAVRAMDAPLCDTPVVVMTGCSPTPENRKRADQLGAQELLHKPIPLDDLFEVVARCMGEGKSEAPSKAKSRSLSDLSGNLEQMPLPTLLHNLHGLRATGVLHLSSGRKRKWIQLRDGYPRSVRSNLVNECLGNLLVREGRISHAALAESRRRTRPGRLQGEILVAMEILSEEEMARALRQQADEKLFEIFEWTGGTYRFEMKVGLQRANALGLDRSPANLILQGVRERFPIRRIDEFLRSHADCAPMQSESDFYRMQEVDLGPSDQALLDRLDGRRKLSVFVKDSEEHRRTLYALIAAGLVVLDGSTAEARPLQVRPAPPPPDPKDDQRHAELMALAETLRRQSYFEILDIDPTADVDQTRAAYERVAAVMHPDHYSSSSQAVQRLATEVFEHVTRAYQVLIDPRRRAEYQLDQRKVERDAARAEESDRALDAERHFQQGRILLEQRDYERALMSFGQALELYPDEGDYHAHYGWTLHMCHPGEPSIIEEAIEHVRRGIKLAGHREKSYLFMGRLYKAIGRVAAAERMFTRAVQIQPESVEALRELRLINMRRHKSKGLIGRLFGR